MGRRFGRVGRRIEQRFQGQFLGRGPLGRAFSRNPLPLPVRRQLIKANQLVMAGNAIEAANIFASVSALASQNGMPARSASLAARSALAYFDGNDVDQGMQFAITAVEHCVQAGNLNQAVQIAQQLPAQLNSHGLAQQAAALRSKYDKTLRPLGISLAVASLDQPAATKHLPAQCPACLGPVRPDAVEWIDDRSAECAYCGSILQAE
jgi:hypothetical protein